MAKSDCKHDWIIIEWEDTATYGVVKRIAKKLYCTKCKAFMVIDWAKKK